MLLGPSLLLLASALERLKKLVIVPALGIVEKLDILFLAKIEENKTQTMRKCIDLLLVNNTSEV